MNPEESSSIKFYTTQWCPDCVRAKMILKKYKLSFAEIDIDQDPKARQFVEAFNNGYRSVPTIIFPDNSSLVEPSNAKLIQKIKELGLANSNV